MRIKEGFILRTICGEHVVVGEGLSQVNYNKLISLNGSAAWLWEQVQGRDFNAEDLTALLLERYEVSEEQARADSLKLLNVWKENNLVTE
ncbi:MAG: PqqD family protein [Bacteroidales bacterium]|nr:PqqD family protein [Bacteroidales bacterium]